MSKRKSGLSKLANAESNFIKRNTSTIIRVFGALLLIMGALTISMALSDGNTYPKTTAEFAKTSVKLVSKRGGGGSGVVLESNKNESIILTNRHVCRLVTQGGIVVREGERHWVTHYKMSKNHDLCLVKVNADMGINTKVASEAPTKYTKAFISGHPHLLPHVLTQGNFSGRIFINLVVALRKCTQADYSKARRARDMRTMLMCMFYGGLPVTQTFDSQLVTGTILPGSSGSAVFNEKGEISGLVFASGSRELSYALVVPQPYVYHFVALEAPQQKWKPAKKVLKEENIIKRFVTPEVK